MTGIYAILNLVNNKIYVGQAFNIQKRWKNHRIGLRLNQHSNMYLQYAYIKDGQFSFIFYVIEECIVEQLDIREQYWMDYYRSYEREFGYNLNPTAGNTALGYKHRPETIEAWSKQRKGKKRSEEAKAAIKAGWEKRKANGPVSEETKRKQSESHKGKTKSEEFKEGARKRMIGNTFNNGRIQSKEVIENRTNKIRNKKHTPEQIERIKAGQIRAAKIREKNLMWTW